MSDVFSIDLYDAVVACHDDDADLVDGFIDQVREHVSLDGQTPAIASLADALPGSETKYKGLEETIKNSTILMIFVTTSYAKNSTAFDTFVREHFVNASLENERRYVLPVWVDWDKTVEKPFAIRTWVGCDYRTAEANENEKCWKRLKKQFDSKKAHKKTKEKERERLINYLAKMKELKEQEHIRREEALRQNEIDQVEAQLRKPVPRPRRTSSGASASSDVPMATVVSQPHKTEVYVNVHFNGLTDRSVGPFGQHMPSAPGSSTTSSVPSGSTRSSRSSSGSQCIAPTAARRTSNETVTTASEDGHKQADARCTSGLPLNGAELDSLASFRKVSREIPDNMAAQTEDDMSLCFDLPTPPPATAENTNIPLHNLDSTDTVDINLPDSRRTVYAVEMWSKLPSDEPQLDSARSLRLS